MSENWTSKNIPDLTGKVMVITGGNSGIGYEAAKEFDRKGAQTILACRSMEKAQAAQIKIQTELPDASVKIIQLDLGSLKSVHLFADEFKSKFEHLDVLLNNAGIMAVPYIKTEEGFESQFGVNHLGHFALTGLLIDLMLSTPEARIVNVSSIGHRSGKLDFDNLMFEDGKDYSRTQAYYNTKLANLLFTYELKRRFDLVGAETIAVSAHPGISTTNLADHLFPKILLKFMIPLFGRMNQNASMGALPSIRAAVDPEVTGGQYFGPDGPKERKGYPVVVQSTEASHNKADAQKLWEVSEQLTGVTFDPLD